MIDYFINTFSIDIGVTLLETKVHEVKMYHLSKTTSRKSFFSAIQLTAINN